MLIYRLEGKDSGSCLQPRTEMINRAISQPDALKHSIYHKLGWKWPKSIKSINCVRYTVPIPTLTSKLGFPVPWKPLRHSERQKVGDSTQTAQHTDCTPMSLKELRWKLLFLFRKQKPKRKIKKERDVVKSFIFAGWQRPFTVYTMSKYHTQH